MLQWKRECRDRIANQMARADFIVNALRLNLPAGSLWHENKFALGQLESLVIASIGGMYDINTFDPSDQRLAPRHAMTVFSDLGIEVRHVSDTHEALSQSDIERITIMANSDFDALLSQSGKVVTSRFRRVTCNMDFAATDDDIDRYAERLFDEFAHVLGYPMTFRPLVCGEIFLPSADPMLRDMKQDPADARSAAEFIFENPLPVYAVTKRFQSLVNPGGSLNWLDVSTGNSSRPGIRRLECVGRYF